MDTVKEKAEEILKRSLHGGTINELAQAYLDKCQEVERLKGETYEGKIELTARDCRNIREDALEDAAKLLDESYSYCQDMRDTMCNKRIEELAKEIRALKEQQ